MKMNKRFLLTSVLVVTSLVLSTGLSAAETDPDIDIRLRYAIVNGDTEGVKRFLEDGANATTVYQDGVTPLGEAIARSGESIEIVKMLMHCGADPEVRSNGNSLLSLAQKKDNEELIRILYPYAESDVELYDLAVWYWDKGKELLALEYADEALKLNPFNEKAWGLKGKVYLSDYYYNIKYAETTYHKAYEAALANLKGRKSKDNYKTAVQYALLSANFNEALGLAKEALSLFPGDGNLSLNRAHAMLLLGQKKEAIVFYKKAYTDLQRSDKTAQAVNDDFAILIRRYPDKASDLKWAEKKICEPLQEN